MNELTEKFYKKTLRPDRQHSYEVIVRYIIKNVKPDLKSVIEYGCGAAWFLYYLKNFGINDIIGIEPNKNMLGILDPSIRDDIRFLDLTKKIDLDRWFDLAMSIEVAEHIDEKYADLIIGNITRHTNLLIFSAATPGQGGYEHINEQPFEYWEKKLNIVNFFCDKKRTQNFRAYLTKEKASSWYRKNISIFGRRGE